MNFSRNFSPGQVDLGAMYPLKRDTAQLAIAAPLRRIVLARRLTNECHHGLDLAFRGIVPHWGYAASPRRPPQDLDMSSAILFSCVSRHRLKTNGYRKQKTSHQED